MFNMEKRRLWGKSNCGFSIYKVDLEERWDRLFSKVVLIGQGIRGNGFKLKEGRFRLGTRKKVFIVRVVRYLNKMPREVVDVDPGKLDGALSNLV